MHDDGIDPVRGRGAGTNLHGMHRFVHDRARRTVACRDERPLPVVASIPPLVLPPFEHRQYRGLITRVRHSERRAIAQQEQCLGAQRFLRAVTGTTQHPDQLVHRGRELARQLPEGTRGRRKIGAAHRHTKLEQPGAGVRLTGDHRHAEAARERRHIDPQTGGSRLIHHVEHNDDRQAKVEDLRGEVEVPLEIGRVDDAHDTVGAWCIAAAAEQHIAQHRLVGRTRRQTVGAGQIDQAHPLSVLGEALAHLLFDRHARIVAHLLAQPGKRVEKRGFPAVRVADKGENRLGHGGGAMDAR